MKQQETSELWHNSYESQPDGIRNVIVVSIGIRRDGTQYCYSESGVFTEVYGGRLWAYVEELIPKSLIKQDPL